MNTGTRCMRLIFALTVLVPVTACVRFSQPPAVTTVPPTILAETSRKSPEEYDLTITERFFEPVEDYSSEREESISMIMLHFCSAITLRPDDPYDFNAIHDIFLDNKVSAHYMIDRDGKVYRTMDEERTAWHAGRGSLEGRDEFTDRMNHHSIGIELFAIGTREEMAPYLHKPEYNRIPARHIGYTAAQYEALNKLLDYICDYRAIPRTREHIVGHDEYSRTRTDPGSLFEWDKIIR